MFSGLDEVKGSIISVGIAPTTPSSMGSLNPISRNPYPGVDNGSASVRDDKVSLASFQSERHVE